MNRSALPRRRTAPLRRHRGVVMLFVLIALVVLLIGAAALVRSFNTSLVTAGNIGFKRDLVNQAERAVPTVMTLVQTGALSSATARANNLQAQNYSASILATNDSGIPNALLTDTAFAAVGATANDITVADQQVRVRYLVDRLCSTAGAESVIGATKCALADGGAPPGGSGSNLIRSEDSAGGSAGAVQAQVVYRLSIRVDGPRGTQAFFQTTFTI
jgi:type IV pilus assembly protein PilX